MQRLMRAGTVAAVAAGMLAGVQAAPSLAAGFAHRSPTAGHFRGGPPPAPPHFGGGGPPHFGGGGAPPSFGPGGSVFVENDALEGNQVVAYFRSGTGTLTQAGVYGTGGDGGQLEGSVADHTASQGSLAYDAADNLLLATNAGSDTVSVFSVEGDRLALRQVVPTYGSFPVSVAVEDGSVYVLNAREGGSLQGYALVHGSLFAVPGSHRSLGLPVTTGPEEFTHTPAQVAFSPSGSQLLVTTKAAGQTVDVFGVDRFGGISSAPVVDSEPGVVPFGFAFDRFGHLLLSEAGPSALASFQLNGNGTLTQLDAVDIGQVATCWVTNAAGYTYASNSGSASVTGFSSGFTGQLANLGNTPSGAGTVDATSVGRFLYVQGGAEGIVSEFEVRGNGSLSNIGTVAVPNAKGGEGIVATS
jgi:hypothetical protein